MSNHQSISDLEFKMSDKVLNNTNEIKDLGVIFNSKLTFDAHIDAIVSKAKQRLYLIRKSFISSDSSALIFAFKAYIIPILEYCSTVWSPSSIRDILRIESVQRLFTKTLINCKDCKSYGERLKLCGLTTLERRRLVADLSLFYKICNTIVVVDLGDAIIPLISPITKGHSRRYKVPSARIKLQITSSLT